MNNLFLKVRYGTVVVLVVTKVGHKATIMELPTFTWSINYHLQKLNFYYPALLYCKCALGGLKKSYISFQTVTEDWSIG